ncbi:methyltransferase domain-containing protein [Streptomyces sp. SID8356]|uniref:class I SAM-dependent methyltransferase n=1 Tax=unclassified Streptomyces TaxID=2593676 RepID=UPI00036E2AD2|nr:MULTISPECIES: class I SAM-dependent methyltransferase [unclassified Streptomyces]MYT38652.1 methyltransferase domain-containing protein [Streptomyces sp. SID8356]
MTQAAERAEPVPGDAFGDLLRECWAAGGGLRTVREVLERDDGLLVHADAGNYFTPVEMWPDVDRELLNRVRGPVLDVGCGAGRVLHALRERGVEALGIDTSPGAVRMCRDRGLRAEQASVDDLGSLTETFDTIIMTGNGLGLLQSRERGPAVLRELARVANPGAVILGTSIDPVHLGGPEDPYRRRQASRGLLPGQWRMRVRHGDSATEWFDYVFLSVDDLSELVAASPWTVRGIHQGASTYLAELAWEGPGTESRSAG